MYVERTLVNLILGERTLSSLIFMSLNSLLMCNFKTFFGTLHIQQISFSRSLFPKKQSSQVISDLTTKSTAKKGDAIIWKEKQNKWLFWVMCRAVLSSYLFPVGPLLAILYYTKEQDRN